MAITIPETMPEDWLLDGAVARGCEPDDLDLKHAMTEAYERGLEGMGVSNIMGMLKNLCVNAAPKADSKTMQELAPMVVNHELHAESIASIPDAA